MIAMASSSNDIIVRLKHLIEESGSYSALGGDSGACPTSLWWQVKHTAVFLVMSKMPETPPCRRRLSLAAIEISLPPKPADCRTLVKVEADALVSIPTAATTVRKSSQHPEGTLSPALRVGWRRRGI